MSVFIVVVCNGFLSFVLKSPNGHDVKQAIIGVNSIVSGWKYDILTPLSPY